MSKKGKREKMRFESFGVLYWRKLLASITRIGAMHEAEGNDGDTWGRLKESGVSLGHV